MGTFICNRCNYKFTSSRSTPPAKCPYCSEFGSVKPEATASDLLKEVEDLVEKERV